MVKVLPAIVIIEFRYVDSDITLSYIRYKNSIKMGTQMKQIMHHTRCGQKNVPDFVSDQFFEILLAAKSDQHYQPNTNRAWWRLH